MDVSTKKGDDGTTGLFYGGRVRKDSPLPRAYGAVDEAQAFIGLARAETDDVDLDAALTAICRDLWVLMAELATLHENRGKLVAGQTLVTAEMVDHLEAVGDDIQARFSAPTEFVVPGQSRIAALLDVVRTVVRRAEREALAATTDDSHVVPYLNRLSDLAWVLARWQEGRSLPTRTTD